MTIRKGHDELTIATSPKIQVSNGRLIGVAAFHAVYIGWRVLPDTWRRGLRVADGLSVALYMTLPLGIIVLCFRRRRPSLIEVTPAGIRITKHESLRGHVFHARNRIGHLTLEPTPGVGEPWRLLLHLKPRRRFGIGSRSAASFKVLSGDRDNLHWAGRSLNAILDLPEHASFSDNV